MLKKPEDKKKKPHKDLKLCYIPKILPGKSYVRVGLSYGAPHTVTEKHYINEKYNISDQHVNIISEKLKPMDPKEKYGKCITENQRYGWYNLSLMDTNPKDRRFNFAKNTDEWVKLYLLTNLKK